MPGRRFPSPWTIDEANNAVATDIVLQPNVGSWGKSGSDCRSVEMTRVTHLGTRVCIAAAGKMLCFAVGEE